MLVTTAVRACMSTQVVSISCKVHYYDDDNMLFFFISAKYSIKCGYLSRDMERVPTYTTSPYLGTFQYKDAGPDRIHRPFHLPFFLPSHMPNIGFLRHDVSLERLHPPSRPTSPSQVPSAATQTSPPPMATMSTQTSVETQDKACQTDVDLSAYVIVDYKAAEQKTNSRTKKNRTTN